MKTLHLFIASILFISSTSLTYAERSCSIDGQLSPELAKYVQEANEFAGKVKQLSSSCQPGKSTGIITNGQRTIDIIEKAKSQIIMMERLDVDFAYNIKMVFKWESRDAVVKNGKIFGQVEKTLVSAIDSVANKCNLNEETETAIVSRLKTNELLEDLYQQTAIGYPGISTDDIPDSYAPVIEEIQKTYNPEATIGCKNEYSAEDITEKILAKIETMSFKIEDSLVDWKYAIALLRWDSSISQEEYSALKKKLLTEELRRQGYSVGAIDQMVKWMTCVEWALRWDDEDTFMDYAQAKFSCARISVLWANRFMKAWNRMILWSKWSRTTAGYIHRYSNYDRVKTVNVDTALVYNSFDTLITKDIEDDEDLLTKFINLHITLLDVNERLEKRINPMITNCKKAQPEIPCDF